MRGILVCANLLSPLLIFFSSFLGMTYEGTFKNDLFNGAGALTYPNGYKWEGKFQNGVPDGKGTTSPLPSPLSPLLPFTFCLSYLRYHDHQLADEPECKEVDVWGGAEGPRHDAERGQGGHQVPLSPRRPRL